MDSAGRREIVIALSVLLLFVVPAPVRSQATVGVSAHTMRSVHRFNSGLAFGTNLKTYGVQGEVLSSWGVGVTAGIDLHDVGIDCLFSRCPGTASTVWTGLLVEGGLGPIGLRITGEVGSSKWSSERSTDWRAMGWMTYPRRGYLQVRAGGGRVRVSPLDGDKVLALGIGWRPRG